MSDNVMNARTPQFWQRLLALEFAPSKARELAARLAEAANPEQALLDGPGLTKSERAKVRSADMVALDNAVANGAYLIEEAEFPLRAQDTSSTPPALFAKGDFGCLQGPAIAIVGTRSATTYGRAVAQKFAEAFAHAGATVVSGGALGIDAAAHKGALGAGGKTAAVMLTSIDRTYPSNHSGLFQQIRSTGVLVSQFAAGSKSSWEYRPLLRNRIIALLSDVVLVVEAPEKSGALNTATAAAELGRQVFVVPANIDNLNFRGSHALIRDGATLADHPEVVLSALGLMRVPEKPSATVGVLQRQIIETLSTTPLATEFIAERTGLDLATLMSELTMLEIEGHVIRDAGGFAIRP